MWVCTVYARVFTKDGKMECSNKPRTTLNVEALQCGSHGIEVCNLCQCSDKGMHARSLYQTTPRWEGHGLTSHVLVGVAHDVCLHKLLIITL